MGSIGLFSADEIANLSGGRRPPSPKGYKLPSIFPSFNKAKRVSIDLESHDTWLGNKLGPGWRRDAYICGFAVALGDKKGNIEHSEYYPLRHKNAPNLDAERVLDWLATELAFYQGEIVGTNLLYDFDGFQYQNVTAPLAKFRDIQWAEALIDENAFSYGLNTLAKKYLGEGKVNEELKQLYGDHYIERFPEVHPGHARAYGLGDVELPMKVLDCQQKILHKEHLEELYDLESRLLPFLLYMRREGTRVDLKKAAEMGPLLTKRRDDAIAEIAKMSGIGVNYDNFGTPAMMKRIFDKLQIPYPYLLSVEKGSPLKGSDDDGRIVMPGSPDYEAATKGNVGAYIAKPSFRKVWLEETLEHPIAELIMTANSAEKARGTFVEGYIGQNAIGDRIHCEFHPLRKVDDEDKKSKGTITGRFSCAAGWTPVLTITGTRPLSEVKIGEMVWTHKNRWRPVTHTWLKGREQMFDVVLENGNILTCTGDHLVLELKNEHIKKLGTRTKEYQQRAGDVSLYRTVDCRKNSRAYEYNLSQRQPRATKLSTTRGVQSAGVAALFSIQNGEQESHDRQNRSITPSLDRRNQRWVRVSDLFERWQTSVRTQNNNGDSAWLAGTSRDFRRASHRRKHRAQRTGQSCSDDTCRSQDNSLFTSEGFSSVAIKKIDAGGVHKVYDITVADDESYLSAGIFSHNSSNPNLQNIPTRDPYIGPMCRDMFLPDDDCDFFSADYSQIEYRMLIHFAVINKCSGAEVPQQMYLQNPKTDFHDACAQMMYKEKWDAAVTRHLHGEISEKECKAILKELRAPAKNLNFGMCLSPEMRLLKTDLTWNAAINVKVGDHVVGFDEERIGKSSRRYRDAVVERVDVIELPCVKITTDKGEYTCSEDHVWLARGQKGMPRKRGGVLLANPYCLNWIPSAQLRPGHKIPVLCKPWETDESRDAGWLAGVFDGEGHLSVVKGYHSQLGFAQNEGRVLSEAERLLKERRYDCVVDNKDAGKKCKSLRIRGGREEAMRFIGSVRPLRLLSKAWALWEGAACWCGDSQYETVVKVEAVGTQQVVSIRTSTRTFIAEGLLSHNCYGMGVALLAEKLGEIDGNGKPTKRALEIMAEYHVAAPYIKELNDLCIKEAEEKNFITTILGRRGRFPLWQERFKKKGHVYDKDADKPRLYEEAVAAWGARNISVCGAHKALNKKLQGSAADMIKKAMVDIWESGVLNEGVHVQLTVHDELDGSVERTNRARAALEEMVRLMEVAVPLCIPTKVSCETGTSWATTH